MKIKHFKVPYDPSKEYVVPHTAGGGNKLTYKPVQIDNIENKLNDVRTLKEVRETTTHIQAICEASIEYVLSPAFNNLSNEQTNKIINGLNNTKKLMGTVYSTLLKYR
jgi:hypothetical protein